MTQYNVNKLDLDKIRTVGILGDRNFGKTSIMFRLAKEYKGTRTIYFYGYPKTDIPYKIIHQLAELELLTDAIVFMDELQKHIKFYEKNKSNQFLELLSVLAHNNVTLIFSTPMSQFINKALDCFLDGFIYVRITDMGALKNGSKAKRLLQEFSCSRISARTIRLDAGEFLQIIDGCEDSNGLHKFENPGIGKDWNSRKIPEICPVVPPKNCGNQTILQGGKDDGNQPQSPK